MIRAWIAIAGVVLLSSCATPSIKKSWTGETGPIAKSLIQLLREDKDVKIAILGESSTSLSDEFFTKQGADIYRWKQANSASMQSMIETTYLRELGNNKNFQIVDHSKIEEILSEQKLSLTGAVSQETAVRVGKISGANYIYFWQLLRFPNDRGGISDRITTKLVEIETSRVIASAWQVWTK